MRYTIDSRIQVMLLFSLQGKFRSRWSPLRFRTVWRRSTSTRASSSTWQPGWSSDSVRCWGWSRRTSRAAPPPPTTSSSASYSATTRWLRRRRGGLRRRPRTRHNGNRGWDSRVAQIFLHAIIIIRGVSMFDWRLNLTSKPARRCMHACKHIFPETMMVNLVCRWWIFG